MYRTSPVRCIFFCPFLENYHQNFSFHRLFRRHLFVTPHAPSESGFYYELLRMCTWVTGCMRCDGWEPAFFRPSGEIFREKIRSRVRTECARIHMRPHAGTEGHRRSEAGEVVPLLPRGSRVDCGVSDSRRGAEAATKTRPGNCIFGCCFGCIARCFLSEPPSPL